MKTFAATLLLSTSLAAPALAEPVDDAEIIVTASGVPQDEAQIGQSVTLVDRATIETRQAVSIADLLATTPGVSVTRNGGFGVTSLRIRGAEAEQTLVLIDGVRVNDPSSPGGAFDFGNLLAGSVERIEVLRGPGSVAWGSQAIGGVVNIVTRAPADRIAASGNVEYGSDDTVFANAALSGSSGAVSGALTAGYLRSDGFSAAADGTEPDGYRQLGATGRIGIALAPGIGIELRGYFADSRIDLDGFPPPDYVFADTAEYSTAQEIYGYAGVHAELLGGRLKNRLAFTLADIARDNYDPTSGPDPVFFGRGRSERYEYQGDLRIAPGVRAVIGAEHEDSRYRDGGPSQHSGISEIYGELIVRPVAPLTLTGGLRHSDHDRFGAHDTLAASGALALGTGTILRASYGEGFKAPTLYQLFSYYGTPTLTPETSRSWQAGVEQRALGDRLRAAATWFERDTRDQIDFDLATYTYSNLKRTHAQGVEFELALRPVDGFMVTANFTHVRAESRAGATAGRLLARRPQDTLSVSGDYRFPFGLALGSTLMIVGDSFDDSGNFVRLDGYALLSLRAEISLSDRIALYGRVENLTDADYRTVSGYATLGRAGFAGARLRI